MTDSNVVKLEPGATDAARATVYRAQLDELIKPVLALMDEAKAAGLVINFVIGADVFGRSALAKPL